MSARLRYAAAGDGIWHLPELAAKALGRFEAREVHVDAVDRRGGLEIIRGLLDGDIDIASGGIWRPLLHSGHAGPLRAFAQLTRRCPFSLFVRESEAFDIDRLEGSVVVVPSQAPSPTVLLRHVLRRRGVGPQSLRVVHGLRTDEAHHLFLAGLGDLCLACPPASEGLRRQGAREVLSLAETAGDIPWTVFYTTVDIAAQRGEQLAAFARAVDDGLTWVHDRISGDDTDDIARLLPTMAPEVVTGSVTWCEERGVWPSTTDIDLDALDTWQQALVDDGLLTRPVAHDDAVAQLGE